jgi:hypothetical protein
MAVSSGVSFFLSSTLAVLLFAGMQLYKQQFAAYEWMTIVGGFLGSLLFCLILTAISNLESTMFGKNFQTQLFPEVIMSLFLAMFASGLIHRVCVTTCFLFSIMDLYYINKLSQTLYTPPVVMAAPTKSSKKKN